MMMMGSTDTIPHFRSSYFNRGPRQKMSAVRWLRILLDLRKHSIDLTWLDSLNSSEQVTVILLSISL